MTSYLATKKTRADPNSPQTTLKKQTKHLKFSPKFRFERATASSSNKLLPKQSQLTYFDSTEALPQTSPCMAPFAALRGKRAEKLNYKIREAELQKIPIMCVLGDQEEEAGTVSPRLRRAGEHRAEALAVDAFVEDLRGRVARREV